jgi:hypothetical protein
VTADVWLLPDVLYRGPQGMLAGDGRCTSMFGLTLITSAAICNTDRAGRAFFSLSVFAASTSDRVGWSVAIAIIFWACLRMPQTVRSVPSCSSSACSSGWARAWSVLEGTVDGRCKLAAVELT